MASLKRFQGPHEGCTNVHFGSLKSVGKIQTMSFWAEGKFEVHSVSSDDLSAVTDGTAQHHTEDHPNYHDASNADSHISNYVQLTVEEVFNSSLTVLYI